MMGLRRGRARDFGLGKDPRAFKIAGLERFDRLLNCAFMERLSAARAQCVNSREPSVAVVDFSFATPRLSVASMSTSMT